MPTNVHAVGILIENNLGEILVLKRNINKPEGNTWGLVGGKVEEKDKSLKKSAERESLEEIGLIITDRDLKFIRTFNWSRSDLRIEFNVFKLVKNIDTHKINLKKDEATDYIWETPENLFKRNDLMIGLYEILKSVYTTL